MKNLLNSIICLFLLFVSVNFAQKQTPKQMKKKTRVTQEKKAEFVCQFPASVIDIKLSQSEIVLSYLSADENRPNNKIINVETLAVDIEDMKYVYIVSAGKIIGEGAQVKWDLSDVKPGSYTITAGISQPIFDGKSWEVLGMTKTKTLVIKE